MGRVANPWGWRLMEKLPRPVHATPLDFEATYRTIGELGGRWGGLEALPLRRSVPFVVLTGRVGATYMLGRPAHRAIAFELGEATVRIAEASFVRAVRELYLDPKSGLDWELIVIELQLGAMVELEEIPSSRVG